jgi:hypothetical protein
MPPEPNILSIDADIQQAFQDEKDKISEYTKKLEELQVYAEKPKIQHRVRVNLQTKCNELEKRINLIKSEVKWNFYIAETAELISDYKMILKTPIKVSFVGKRKKEDKEKNAIINTYLKIASNYTNLEFSTPPKKPKIICDFCPNRKNFEIIDGNTYICSECSSQQIVMKHISSFNDSDRVNISAKYTYARNIHFRDCMNQYQGKQNSTVDQKVYDQLEEQFKKHHLLTDSSNMETRFENITKEHIHIFLKSLKHTKHYENVNLIHYNLTGVKPDDIGYLEDQLLVDFDVLTNLYDQRFKHLVRKNFINTQYVLYQLLMRHKHPCNKEDFTILKTIDRELFHDEVCKDLFYQLNWNHSPTF